MMRSSLVWFAAVSLLCGIVAAAGNAAPATAPADGSAPQALLVRVQKVKTRADEAIAVELGGAPDAAVPKDAQIVTSAETITTPGGEFSCTVSANGTTVKLTGALRAVREHRVQVEVDFEERTRDGVTSFRTNLMPPIGELIVIGKLLGGEREASLLVMTVAPPAEAKAATTAATGR